MHRGLLRLAGSRSIPQRALARHSIGRGGNRLRCPRLRERGDGLADRQTAYGRRQGEGFRIVCIDLDRLKAINDEYSREEGDLADA
jgi:GGDEF domain-containing protein